jgi:hypothetical protein
LHTKELCGRLPWRKSAQGIGSSIRPRSTRSASSLISDSLSPSITVSQFSLVHLLLPNLRCACACVCMYQGLKLVFSPSSFFPAARALVSVCSRTVFSPFSFFPFPATYFYRSRSSFVICCVNTTTLCDSLTKTLATTL